MYALAVTALLALATAAHAQEAVVWVDVNPTTDEGVVDVVEKRTTPELVKSLQTTKDEALLLYTEYTAQAGKKLRKFMRDMTGFADRSAATIDTTVLENAPESCRDELHRKLFKVESDGKLEASFSAVNHHKFFLGHMVVFRMHLNKSEDYIKKCERMYFTCGNACEHRGKVVRWRRLAKSEIDRVKDDIEHSRRSYADLLTHQHRQLNKLHRKAHSKAEEIIGEFLACTKL